MNVTSRTISINSLTRVNPPSGKIIPPEDFEKKFDPQKSIDIEAELRKLEAEQPARLAHQHAIPIDSVFKLNGKIIAAVTSNGWTTSLIGKIDTSGSPDTHMPDSDRVGRTQSALAAYKTAEFSEILRKRYGSNLVIETREHGLDMNEGQLAALINNQ